jgi:predicted ester cyclase
MSIEENKAIARRWNEELFDKGNPDIIDELAHPDYVSHPGMSSHEAFKQSAMQMGSVLSDWSITLEDLIAEGDRVAFRWTAHATHSGPYMGVQPTGKQITLMGITIYRIADGKVIEDWHVANELGFQKQFGVTPDMSQVPESSWD